MNGTKDKDQQQLISFSCPEENLAALITSAKENFEGTFAALKSELVHYLLYSSRELMAGPKHAPHQGFSNWGSQRGSVYVAGKKSESLGSEAKGKSSRCLCTRP